MTNIPSIFLSHNHADNLFTRRLATDLGALGARVWLDQAEINIGDSLIEKIESALDSVNYLAVILTPDSVASSWVKEEVRHVVHGRLSGRGISILPILLKDCTIPGFLREKRYVDFRDESTYDQGLETLARTLGLNIDGAFGAMIRDPFARKYGRVEHYVARPRQWFCIFCGWYCDSGAGYTCFGCHKLRLFYPWEAVTMSQCNQCRQWNIAIASYCEWCGAGTNEL